MRNPVEASASILIASDSITHATLVKKLLDDEFEHVRVSTHPDAAADDFDLQKPEVLVLAFGVLEKSERYNLGLFRQSKEIHLQPHRTIILCNKDEARRAYELCRDQLFDDYILFWPVAHDANRLPMAVHHAIRELEGNKAVGSISKELSTQLKSLAELETLLLQGMAGGDEHIESTARVLDQATQDIGSAITRFTQRMLKGDLSSLVDVRNGKALEQAFEQLKRESLETSIQAIVGSVPPLKQWAEGFRQSSAPHLETIRAMQAPGLEFPPTLMVVDDDPYQHKIVDGLVKELGYRVVFAGSGIDALNLLRKVQPDLMLIDYSMPGMDGLEVTRRILGIDRFSRIPIIMITGNSEENVVTESLKAGAVDFMVKPLGREALIGKITHILEVAQRPFSEELQDLDVSDL